MNSLKVFSVIVIYNGMRRDWIEKCFTSLVTADVTTEIIAIDNCSKDDSVAYIKERFPTVTLIASDKNLGFAKANNVGIKMAMDAGADFIFLLNQDAWLVKKDDLSQLINTSIANPEYGILSPVVLTGDATDLDYTFKLYTQGHNYEYPRDKERSGVLSVPFVNAAAWLIPKHCFQKVGGFDTVVFQHYGEDDNYAQRVSYIGLKTVVVCGSFICHDTLSVAGVNPEYKSKMKWIETKIYISDINCTEKQRFLNVVRACKIQMFHGNSSFAKLKESWSVIFKVVRLYLKVAIRGRKAFFNPEVRL